MAFSEGFSEGRTCPLRDGNFRRQGHLRVGRSQQRLRQLQAQCVMTQGKCHYIAIAHTLSIRPEKDKRNRLTQRLVSHKRTFSSTPVSPYPCPMMLRAELRTMSNPPDLTDVSAVSSALSGNVPLISVMRSGVICED